jgi:5-methylcytosine-specific restriction enzyme subunit McrC
MYWRNHRRPLRTYRRLRAADFAVDGDFDAADLLMPDEQGFEQVLTSFTRANPFNTVIRAAADALAPVVPDPETRARLERVAHSLPRQGPPGRLQDRRLPSRGRAWQATYDLSLDVLRGLGGAYDPGAAIAPGYIVSTWQVWETLVALALRTAFGQRSVRSQAELRLGDRQRAGATVALNVTPDNVAQIMGSTVVLDAKYKGRVGARKQGVDAPDVYEALAFMRAAGVDRAVLVYPRVPDGTPRQPGAAAEMERIKVSGTTIVAIEVTVSGIARPQGLKTFIAQLRGEIEHLVPTI